MLAGDGDCFALFDARQHGITMHGFMREREKKKRGGGVNISFITQYMRGRLVQLLLSIILGGGKKSTWGRDIQCVPPLLLHQTITMDNLIVRIDCPPLNHE